jgi:hypothetical protein
MRGLPHNATTEFSQYYVLPRHFYSMERFFPQILDPNASISKNRQKKITKVNLQRIPLAYTSIKILDLP